MARIKRGIMDDLSGKVGKVIGGTWNGIPYIRSVPAKVKNPNTVAQQKQRMRFKLLAGLLYSLQPYLMIGFANGVKGRTPVNRAMTQNLPNAISGEFPEYEVDYAQLVLSRGNLTPVFAASVEADTPGEININWENNQDQGSAKEDDQALILVYNTEKSLPVMMLDHAVRADETLKVNIPPALQGDTYHVWISFSQEDSGKVSDSMYLGSVNTEPESEPED